MEIDKDLNKSIEITHLKKIEDKLIKYRLFSNGEWTEMPIATYSSFMLNDDIQLIRNDIIRLLRIIEEKGYYIIEFKAV